MLEIEWTTSIKRDLKKYRHQKAVLKALDEVIELLVQEQPLATKHCDHPLGGPWTKHRECHVKNDELLIYKVVGRKLFLTRFGSHSELFG